MVVAPVVSCTSQRGYQGYRVAFDFSVQGVGYVHPLDLVSVGRWRGVGMVEMCSCVFI